MNKISFENNKSGFINGLDSIRFFLAFIVLLSHFSNPWSIYFKSSNFLFFRVFGILIPNLFCGAAAVIAFFIVSGIVIHYPNKEGIIDIKKFLIRRWVRIGIPLFVISCIGFATSTFDAIPIWSLYCELIFYSIYPFLFKIPLPWKSKFLISFFIAFLIIIYFTSDDINSLIHQKNYDYNGAYWQLGVFLTWLIGLPCWLLGILLSENIDKLYQEPSRFKLYLLRLIVFVLTIIVNVIKFHYFVSFIFSLNLLAFILYYWLFSEILYYKTNKVNPYTEALGKFSYSIYLCHTLIFILLKIYIPLNNYTYLIYILLAIVLSFFYFLLVEKPSHEFARILSKKVK